MKNRIDHLIGPACLIASVLAGSACHRDSAAPARQEPAPATTKPAAAAASASPAPVHDPSHPPIDCPLAKQGIDPANLKPFEDTEKYIAFLERPDRAAWQKPDAVVSALGLTGKETVVDLGAGSGYFSFRIARALPAGKVVAIDIDPEMIRHIHHKATSEGVANLEAVLGKADDPGLPAGADLVLVCDVLHHVADRVDWLARLVAEMAPGARLVLIEFKEGDLPEGPPEAAKIPRAELIALVTKAGLDLVGEQPDLLPYQTYLLFQKPRTGSAARSGTRSPAAR